MHRSMGAFMLTALSLFAITAGPVALAATGPVLKSGYTLTTFATGTTAYWNPDDITTDGRHVYVEFQNTNVKDGTVPGESTIVQYTIRGKALQTYPATGHADGLKYDHATGRLWAMSNEDGRPFLTVIRTSDGFENVYRLPSVDGGGGFDDIVFAKTGTYISASNPTLNTKGINVYPALERIVLRGNGHFSLTPVLNGNSAAIDRTSGKHVKLDLTDPDSLSIDPTTGEVVLDSQGDSELVFVAACHLTGRKCNGSGVSRVLLRPQGANGPMVDDTEWSSGTARRLLITDQSKPGVVYQLKKSGGFGKTPVPYTTPYSTVATLNTKSGQTKPVASQFVAPKGLLFLP